GEWKKAVQAYLACVTFADDCIGHVLEALENSKYKDNTIVILWTDHGWQLGHKNRWEKFSLWKQGTNAPLIIRLPGEKEHKLCEKAVSFLDIYPTLADLAGFEQPDYLEGQSLRPLIENPNSEWKIPAVVTYPNNNHSVVRDSWNYIRYEDGTEELYNQTEDPTEFYNLSSDTQYRSLMDELAGFIPETKAAFTDTAFAR
ncbi:MAG: sulfatase-like hydrolase/transferase, partial [Bacteroidales bacterium]|nr:sulfatase-like hydrolase/transferase [Bacteroidales bacterium]